MHPDITYLLDQANTDMGALGHDDGVLEAAAYLRSLIVAQADRPSFAEGIEEIADAVEAETELSDEYRSRTAEVGELSYDPRPLIAALDGIRQNSRAAGHAAAVEAAYTTADGEEPGEPPDPDDYDEPEDYEADLEAFDDSVEVDDGRHFASRALVEHFRVMPDEDWPEWLTTAPVETPEPVAHLTTAAAFPSVPGGHADSGNYSATPGVATPHGLYR
jgi:hypothetical protein